MDRLPYQATPLGAAYERLRLPVSVLLDDVRSMYNVGAFFRTADGVGLEIAAIETTLHSVDLFDWQPRFPVCVLFGHEVDGLRRELLERADVSVRIPMLGAKHSLNVATAGGVVLYELLRKYRVAHELR